jgi:hypothetical protein
MNLSIEQVQPLLEFPKRGFTMTHYTNDIYQKKSRLVSAKHHIRLPFHVQDGFLPLSKTRLELHVRIALISFVLLQPILTEERHLGTYFIKHLKFFFLDLVILYTEYILFGI